MFYKIRVKVKYGPQGSFVVRADGDYSKKDFADIRYAIFDLGQYDIDLIVDKGKKPSEICKEHRAEVGGNCLFAWVDKGKYVPMGHVVKNEKVIQTTAQEKWADFILPVSGKPYIGQADISNVKGIKLAFSGTPQLVREGQIFINSWAEGTPGDIKNNLRAKTGLGITKDGKIIYAVLDHSPDDGPMRIDEFALVLIYLGAWEAINLDGGGSSVFWAGKVLNYPAKTRGERATSSALIFKEKIVNRSHPFIEKIKPAAVNIQSKTGIPASVIIAQACLETAFGNKVSKETGKDSRNLFNIKGTGPAGSVKVLTTEYYSGKPKKVYANFRAYHTYEESFADYVQLLMKPRYSSALAVKHDPKQFAQKLQDCGYATDPRYAWKLINIMELYGLCAG